MYKMCLVSHRPATSSSTLGIVIITQSHRSQLSFHLGSVRSTRSEFGTNTTVVPRYKTKKNISSISSHLLTRHRLNLWHLSAQTASFTTQNLLDIRNDCLHNVHCKKQQFFLPVYCILRLSLFLLLCWTSPLDSWNLCKICDMLDRPSSSGFLCFIIYNLVGLWVYIWRRNEPPWCPVLFVCETGWTAVQSVLIWACRYQPLLQPWLKWNIFFLFVQPSVSLISNFFDQFFWRQSASLLSSAVIWCFLYIRHEFDTAIVAIFIKIFSRNFPYLFVKRWQMNYNDNFFWGEFCFSMIAFFPMLWHF